MPWTQKFLALFHISRGPCLRDLENRVERLERHLEVLQADADDEPSASPQPARKQMSDAQTRQIEAQELLNSGLSQSETARRLGVTRQYIHQLAHKGPRFKRS